MYFSSLPQEWIDDKMNKSVTHEYVWNKDQFDDVNPLETDYLLGKII